MNQSFVAKPQPFKHFPITSLLLSSLVILFIWQILTGVDANTPSSQDLITWGANTLALSMQHQPWRLISAGFLHIGIMHLMFNGFALYFFGQVAEKLFGKLVFIILFIASVVGGNLLNSYVTWHAVLHNHSSPGIAAGASGGIMGIGAALLVCAVFKRSVNGISLNLKSLMMIMGINLLYGFVGVGVDNAAHIGGALTGIIITGLYIVIEKAQLKMMHHTKINKVYTGIQPLIITLCMLGIFVYAWIYLNRQMLAFLQG